MLKIAVCDDEPVSLQSAVLLIKKWINEHNAEAEVLSFCNGDELLKECSSTHFDIVFLDIIMPLFNGIDTAKDLRKVDNSSKIIFLTSSPEFALESYEVHAQDYVLKPISYDRLSKALADCVFLNSEEAENIIVKTTSGFRRIYFKNIEFAEAQNKKVMLHLLDGEKTEISEPLYSFSEKLSSTPGFFKCHRSYIVYLGNVETFNNTELTTKSNMRIPISRSLVKAFQEAYFSFVKNN